MNCPTCRGSVVANTAKSKPTQPDWLCANENCKNDKGYRSGLWNDKPSGNQSGGGGGGRKGGWQPPPRLWKTDQLGKAYGWALKQAEAAVVESSKRTKVAFTTADVLNGAATLFIAIAGNVDPRPAAPPTPPPPPPEPLDKRPAALGDANEDDIP